MAPCRPVSYTHLIWQLQLPTPVNSSSSSSSTSSASVSIPEYSIPSTINTISTSTTPRSSAHQHLLPSRQLHVIDTSIRNIPITKQKRKKPTKIPNTTSSIVEWRKKLGISSNNNNNNHVLTNIDITDTEGLSIDTELSSSNFITNPPPPPPTQILRQHSQSSPPSYPNTSSNLTLEQVIDQIPTEYKQSPTKNKMGPTLMMNNNGISENQTQDHIIPSTPPVPPFFPHSSNRSPISTSVSMSTLDKYLNNADINKNRKLAKDSVINITNESVLKQDYVYIYTIPFKADGPAMCLDSYSQIDNDLITSLVSKYKTSLKSVNTLPCILMLGKNGDLSYVKNNSPTSPTASKNSELMVNVADSDLSMYDFEFDELARKGFLILERYRKKLWFISLPSIPILSSISPPSQTLVSIFSHPHS